MESLQDLMKRIAPIDGATSVSPSELTDEEKREKCQKLCDTYNAMPGNLNEADGYDCPECKNKGFISAPVKDPRGNWVEQSSFCKCRKIRSTIRRLNKSGLKNIIKDYTFKNFKTDEPWQKTMKDAAVKFVQDEEHSWFFAGGSSGSGKTHLCTAIAGYFLNHGKEVKYMLWRDDVVKLKGNVNNPEEYEKAMHELKEAEVLYIDDLFKTGKDSEGNAQRPTPADINIAFELLNYRYNNPKLITIISSESMVTDILDIDEAVGGRIVERAVSCGYGINIKPDRTKNYRLKGMLEL